MSLSIKRCTVGASCLRLREHFDGLTRCPGHKASQRHRRRLWLWLWLEVDIWRQQEIAVRGTDRSPATMKPHAVTRVHNCCRSCC